MRPLTHNSFTNADRRRIGKKIATLVAKGEPLTEPLVKKLDAIADRFQPSSGTDGFSFDFNTRAMV